jgi:ATP-binding cassette subfamily B protein
MEVERHQVEEVEALRPAKDRPAARLGTEHPGERPPRTLLAMLKPVRGLVVLAVLLMAADAAVTTLIPTLVQRGLDEGVSLRNMSTLWWSAGIALAVIAVNWFVLFAQPRVIARTGESALFSMRVRSFRHLHRLGLDFFERSRSGGVLTSMTTDITALADFVEAGLTVAVVNLLTIGVMAVAMVLLDFRLALVAFAVLPVLVVATVIFRRLSSTAYQETRDQIGEVNADLAESMAGLRTAQAHGQTDGARARFGKLSEAFRRVRLRAQSYAAAYFPFITLLSDVAIILVLAYGVDRIAAGTLTPGVLTAFLLYLGLFFAPFQQLSMVFDGYQRASVGAARLGQLLETPPLVTSAPGARSVSDRLRGEVELDHVTFRYPEAEAASLTDVSVSVAPQQRVALVGATGSGKSTLVKLVARLYDASEGELRIDGHDVRGYDLTGLRSRLAVVPQEAHLFSGSVADNIRYGRADASDDDVQAAVMAVGALAMIAELPHGFDQQVGERGGGLSTGQRQLVALARAQVADPDILLLDEPTASLDAVAERAVLTAMDELASARTTFVVTHRLASAARSDLILVLDDGRLVERGSHEELLARGGHYAMLWALDQGPETAAPAPSATGPDDDLPPARRLALVTTLALQLAALARHLVSLTRRREGTARRTPRSAVAAVLRRVRRPAAGRGSGRAAGRT